MTDLQLINAVKTSNLAAIKDLVESGADIDQQDEQGWTPLNWAAGKGDVDAVRLLLEKGADFYKVGRDQRTPYMIALAAARVDVVKLLKETEINQHGEFKQQEKRIYCKAYHLRDLRQFSGWSESRINWKEKKGNNQAESEEKEFSESDVAFLHQDHTVTYSMWHNESVIFNQVTPEWESFCANVLEFRVPEDLDLI
jgi:hypothetical protein